MPSEKPAAAAATPPKAAKTKPVTLEALIKEKTAAGLPLADATDCAKAQLAHDAALAEADES